MNKPNNKKLIEQLKVEEGCRLKAYRCTAGFLTIGYGHNLDAKPRAADGSRIANAISQATAEQLLRDDAAETIEKLTAVWPRISEFDTARRDAFFNMAFQLGVGGFMKFERMRAAALARDWPAAHAQALNSNWAKQTPARARRVAQQILTGKYYEFS